MGTPVKDVELPDRPELQELLLEKHASYIETFEKNKDDLDYCMTEFLRISGIYWCLTAMDLIGQLDRMNKTEILDYVMSCFDKDTGGFRPAVNHDPHLLYTLSAVQIFILYDSVSLIDKDRIVSFVSKLQQPDGSFVGDRWGEVDTRFSFCGLATLSLLGRLDAVDIEKSVQFISSCMNFDGGFGVIPGSESHAGQVYCCVGSLAICKRLDVINADQLGWWLCERQLPSGGLNGRPEKLPDVCYSWWVLASLSIIGRIHWIDKERLTQFIMATQDDETGGFSDRPGDMVDPFHTLFGLAGLSLLGNRQIKGVNPIFCLPQNVIERLELDYELLKE